MSGGDNPMFLPHLQQQEDKEGAVDPNSPHPMSENLQGKGNLDGADDDDDDDDDQKKMEQLEEIKNDEETDKATVSSRGSEKQIAEEDDDGFKTPTSSDHRIPATTQCPPAPKKPRPQTSKLKRKASPPPGARRSLQFEASTEVESIFRQIPDQQDNIEEQKIKKARREDDQDSS
ncbi:UNVERIFIED_CONTAM: Cyclin-dependent protein kinase inhibitor SMR3 [Sesamum indicum]